ncbi:MAG: CYTH domain-containing protein [Bacteroidota bacterium]
MRELEIKILEVDPQKIRQCLEEVGAKKSFDGEMLALFLDYEDRRISKRGDVLRIRREDQEIRLTYKSHISQEGIKEMEELETSAGDAETLIRIFEQLGCGIVKQTRKFRTQYEWKGTHIVLDDYKDDLSEIPVFVEIEALDPESLFETASMLGFSKGDCKSWNTYDLIRYYGLS